MVLTAVYKVSPTELELELLDDIVTNSNAPISDFFVVANVKLMEDFKDKEQHDFVVFAFFDA